MSARGSLWFLRKASRRMVVMDFDDTLVSSAGGVGVTKPSGERIQMLNSTFTHYGTQPGDQLDFTLANHVIEPRIIKRNFEDLREAAKRGDRTVILTARPASVDTAIHQLLEQEGVKGVDVVGLGSSAPADKARWIADEAKRGGYSSVEFRDDSAKNVQAVEQASKDMPGVAVKAVLVPLPKDADFAGPPQQLTFLAAKPTTTVVQVPLARQQSLPGSGGGWWGQQSEHFHQHYCGEHPHSRYC